MQINQVKAETLTCEKIYRNEIVIRDISRNISLTTNKTQNHVYLPSNKSEIPFKIQLF